MKATSWLLGLLAISCIALSFAEEDVASDVADVPSADDGVEVEVDVSEDATSDQGAEDQEYDMEELEEELSKYVLSSPDALTTHIFPDSPDRKFTLGEPVKLLLGFTNKGNKPFTINNIAAFLHSPFDFKYFIQNFTRQFVGTTVGPHEQVSVEYNFLPDPTLEPLEFWFSAHVIYNSSMNNTFLTTFFNSTVELVEKDADVRFRQFVFYVMLAVFLGLAGYFGHGYVNKSFKKRSTRRPAGTPAKSPAASTDDGWGDLKKYKRASPKKPVARKTTPKSQ